MVRPSHYLFLFTALFVATGWWLSWGGLGGGESEDSARGQRGSPAVVANQIRGTVLDRFGWPVPGARVGEGTSGTRTDSQGHFRITPPGPAAFDLRISAPDHSERWERAHPASEEPLIVILGDQLPWMAQAARPEPGPAATRWAGDGFVQDAAGQPVRSALVTVAETGVTVRTDDVGHYIIPLPRTVASLIARHGSGLVARAGPFSPPRDRAEGLTPLPKLTMVQGGRLHGILRGPAGDPVPGGLVLEDGAGLQRWAEAGTDGKYEISGLFTGKYELTALPHEGSLGFRRDVLIDGEVELGLELLPEEELRIQVVDSQGEPQAGAHVVAQEAGLRVAHAQADAAGWVTLSGLAGGGRQFSVRSAVDFGELPVIRRVGDQLIVAVD